MNKKFIIVGVIIIVVIAYFLFFNKPSLSQLQKMNWMDKDGNRFSGNVIQKNSSGDLYLDFGDKWVGVYSDGKITWHNITRGSGTSVWTKA